MTWEEIKNEVAKNGGVKTYAMGSLRDTHGAGRLGVNVCQEISEKLAGEGLGHIPQDLPSFQDEQIRLYKKGTAVGKLIDTVLSPGEQNDLSLSERFSSESPDYASMIEQIRDIVGK